LDLHDYLGQGTALIGLLDAFWESKGYVTAKEFRRFNGPTVPLAWLAPHILRTSDKFDVEVDIAHFGPEPLKAQIPVWRIVDLDGRVAAQGELPARDIGIGRGGLLGNIATDLSKLTAPREYKLIVGLKGTDIENDWNFWLYPADVDSAPKRDILVTTD